jgi:hypothetical protein
MAAWERRRRTAPTLAGSLQAMVRFPRGVFRVRTAAVVAETLRLLRPAFAYGSQVLGNLPRG